MEGFITPQEVAEKLGLTVYRVHQLIRAGKLPADKIGRFSLVSESDLAAFKAIERKPGRPKKAAAATDAAPAKTQPAKKRTRKGATS